MITANFPDLYTASGSTFTELLQNHVDLSNGWLPSDLDRALDEMVFLLSHFGGDDIVLPKTASIEERARVVFSFMNDRGFILLRRDDGEPLSAEVVEA